MEDEEDGAEDNNEKVEGGNVEVEREEEEEKKDALSPIGHEEIEGEVYYFGLFFFTPP